MKKDLGAKTILFPTPVLVVATYDGQGKANAMTAAWGGICCSDPPCVTVSVRKARHTYDSLMERKAYTVNIPGKGHAWEADYLGVASGKDEDKFAAAGLTAVKSGFVDAPYIEEFPLILECKVVHIADLGAHTQFVGEIMNVKADAAMMENDRLPLIEQIMPLIFAPSSGNYYTIGEEIGKAFSAGKEKKLT
ncbi:MAG: flavin reductase family protein [Clostridiales bacterium]|nr:flavin reductase family protein [Clostridiales bacterium]